MLRQFLLYSLLFTCFGAFAQHVVTIPKKGDIYASKVYGQYLYFMVGSNNAYNSHLYRMQMPKGQPEAIDTNIGYAQSVRMSDSGIFYISFAYDANGNDGKHFINFIPAGSTQKRFQKVVNLYIQHPNRTVPYLSKLINDKYYIVTWFNNKNCIWESDGTEAGTKIVFEYGTEIVDYHLYKNQTITIVLNNNKLYLLNDKGQRLSPNYPNQYKVPFGFFYNSNDVCIYRYNNKLYVCGEMGQIDSTSLNFNGFRAFKVVKSSDSLLYGYNYVGKDLYTYSLRIEAPYHFDSIPSSTTLRSLEYPRFDLSNSQFLSMWSYNYGSELVYAAFEDSLRLVKDLNPGYGSGVSNINYETNLYEQDGIAYFNASNGSDSKRYLYSSDGSYMKSHFSWGYFNYSPQGLYVKDSLYYWSTYKNDTLFILNQNLYTKDTQAVSQTKVRPPHTGEWHRQVTPVLKQSQWSNFSDIIYCRAVFGDKAGNVIVCGNSRGLNPSYIVRCSDTNMVSPMKGDQIVAKYDSIGHLIWMKTFGGFSSWTSLDPAYYVDNNGDVLAFGRYFETANFDSIVLTTLRAAMYVCKISGSTGTILWVREFNPSYYSNNNTTDGIVADKHQNIYLSFSFKNNSAIFDNKQIDADRSPCNGLAKLSSEGEVLWAKSNATSWTDKYGLGRDLIYDSVNNLIYNLIGQGFYNWTASCRYAPFRSNLFQVSPDGTIQLINAQEGNDLNAPVVAEITKNRSIFVSGFYRSNYSAPPFSIASNLDKKTGCTKWEQFYSIVNAENGENIGLQSTQNDAFYPLDICSDAQFIYVLGTQNYQLTIRRYTHLGRYTGKRLLKNCYSGDPFDFNYYYNIASSGEHLLVASNSRIDPFTNFVENYPGLSVYRLAKDKDWIEQTNFNETVPESGIIMAPNPATDFINLQFTNPDNYTELDIYDAMGRIIDTVPLSKEIYQQITINHLASGVYTLHFKGSQSHKEKLVIR